MPRHAALPNPTQLLLRHGEQLGGPLLVVDPPDAASVARIGDLAPALFLIRDYAVLRAARQLAPAAQCRFGPWLDPSAAPVHQALIFLPKGKELLAMTLAMAGALLRRGGEIWLVGGNDEGIRSAAGSLQRFGPVTKVESARHCSLFRATLAGAAAPFEPQAWAALWPLPGSEGINIASLPGVFSQGRLDEGTRRLIGALHTPAGGRLLDVGCGAGILGALLARRCAACQVELVDASALAIEATARTLAANALTHAHVYPSDVFSDVRGRFDLIVSNPPFHSHVKTDYRVHRELIHGAREHLAPGGVLQLVVNRFLRIEPLLAEVLGRVSIDFEDGQYRVYRAQQG